jgi:hypothetical protein
MRVVVALSDAVLDDIAQNLGFAIKLANQYELDFIQSHDSGRDYCQLFCASDIDLLLQR